MKPAVANDDLGRALVLLGEGLLWMPDEPADQFVARAKQAAEIVLADVGLSELEVLAWLTGTPPPNLTANQIEFAIWAVSMLGHLDDLALAIERENSEEAARQGLLIGAIASNIARFIGPKVAGRATKEKRELRMAKVQQKIDELHAKNSRWSNTALLQRVAVALNCPERALWDAKRDGLIQLPKRQKKK